MGYCPWGKTCSKEIWHFQVRRYEKLSRTVKKPKLKMENAENFQERIMARKPFFYPS